MSGHFATTSPPETGQGLIPLVNNSAQMGNGSSHDFAQLSRVAYEYVLPIIVALGIISNILNLFTLQNANLQSIPFKYIRAIAVFDLAGLLLVLGACVRIAGKTPPNYHLVYYQAHFELPLLNGFLTGSLFTAVALSGERYFMICRPHSTNNCLPPINRYRFNVTLMLVLAMLLHLPMCVEFAAARIGAENNETVSGRNSTDLLDPGYKRVKNPAIEGLETVFSCYEIIREIIRCIAVAGLLVLNTIVIRKLRDASKRRNKLRSRTSGDRTGSVEETLLSPRTEESSRSRLKPLPKGQKKPTRSYEENRITLMMIGMSVVYFIGNIPQAGLMTLNENDYEDSFPYQIVRAVANLAEMNNHCLNFYIFCFTSKDYYTAFFELCRRPCLLCHKVAARMPQPGLSSLRRNVSELSPSIAPEHEIFL